MDRRERPPLAKIPRHESNEIDGSSIGGLSIDLWRVEVTSRYHSGTPGGLGPGAQKTSQSGNFEFCQLLLVCLGMGNMAMPTASHHPWLSSFGPRWHDCIVPY